MAQPDERKLLVVMPNEEVQYAIQSLPFDQETKDQLPAIYVQLPDVPGYDLMSDLNNLDYVVTKWYVSLILRATIERIERGEVNEERREAAEMVLRRVVLWSSLLL